MTPLTGRRWWLACSAVMALTLLALVPTTGDIGLTWDEPAYRHSQEMSSGWWERLSQARSWADVQSLLDKDALLFYWPYGRYGINFHPPLAGQLNLLTYKLFGGFMRDIPARRMADVIQFAATVTMLFGFLARRYGPWVGGVAAASLLFMPRVFGDAHIAATDTPGLFLWAAASLAFWKGLYETGARRWRVLVGVLLGLAFLEKMSAVLVILPIWAWLAAHFLATRKTSFTRAGLADFVLTTGAMLAPLVLVLVEIRRLAAPGILPLPNKIDLFALPPQIQSPLPAAVLLLPLAIWFGRRLLARLWPASPIWGVERPGLETWLAMLAFAPAIGWLGNPAWWRDGIVRLAHYAMLNSGRRGALPDIRIAYFGRIYLYSLPWHNAWVLIAITVPATILAAASVGLVASLGRSRSDRLPAYFLLQLCILPAMRMLNTPAHDGVRLLLPAFFFLAAFAGWGTIILAGWLGRILGGRLAPKLVRAIVASLVVGPAAWATVRVHPYELSYYNELVGGPKMAWHKGFELSYWFDAFNAPTLAEIERVLPRGVQIHTINENDASPTFDELQRLGELRPDLILGSPDKTVTPHAWLLTHDSKANAFTRLLFGMHPLFESRPAQLDGARVAAVMGPKAVSRAVALQLLLDTPGRPDPRPPAWAAALGPLGRFWGVGVSVLPVPGVIEEVIDWARTDPAGLRLAAREVSTRKPAEQLGPDAARLARVFGRYDQPGTSYSGNLLNSRPEVLVEAVEILIARPDAVRAVLRRPTYSDPSDFGGNLDAGLSPDVQATASAGS
ncbi:glycosyltransferase family 39 protein [Isosphaeraceae bacterium EP7]